MDTSFKSFLWHTDMQHMTQYFFFHPLFLLFALNLLSSTRDDWNEDRQEKDEGKEHHKEAQLI